MKAGEALFLSAAVTAAAGYVGQGSPFLLLAFVLSMGCLLVAAIDSERRK